MDFVAIIYLYDIKTVGGFSGNYLRVWHYDCVGFVAIIHVYNTKSEHGFCGNHLRV